MRKYGTKEHLKQFQYKVDMEEIEVKHTHRVKDIQDLEQVQRLFTRRLVGDSINYWERLKHLRLYSLQRRRERYIAIYVWKILEGMVPNPTHNE